MKQLHRVIEVQLMNVLFVLETEEVGTGHVSSKSADVAPLTLLFLEFWTISAGTNRRAERSSE